MKIYTSVAINNEKRCKKTTGRIDSVKTLEIEKICNPLKPTGGPSQDEVVSIVLSEDGSGHSVFLEM